MSKKIAVIYARYSDSKQTEQSIEGQLKICNKYAEENGYSILCEYIDRAQSGKTDDRIQFKKMLSDSKKKQFETVIVYAINRFGRNTRQSLNNAYLLENNGISILSATEAFGNNPAELFFRTITMARDQHFSDELAEKTVRGLGINADNCYSNGGYTPLGFRLEKIDPRAERSKKRYVIDEDTAPIVREVYTKYADGVSIKEICANLNERNLRTTKGAAFNKNSLHTMLKSRKYLGYYIYHYKEGDKEIEIETPGGMPQIIDEDLFNKVAEKMAVNKKAPARARAKAEYILSGKLFCGYCKEKMIGHSSNQVSKKGVIFNYYKCKNSGGGKACKKKLVIKDSIENIIVDECRKLLTPLNIRRIAKELMKIVNSYDDKTEINRLGKLLDDAKQAKNNHMVSLRKCDDTVREMLIEDLSAIGAEIKELEKQLELENARRESVTEKQIIASLTRLADGDVNDVVYRRSLIRLLVNRIFLYDDKYTITFNSGDEEVTITDVLLENIEKGLEGQKLCLLNGSVPQVGLEPTTLRLTAACSTLRHPLT